jgi:hypothetical protein
MSLKNFDEFHAVTEDTDAEHAKHEAAETPVYEDLEEAFMLILKKGLGIDPKSVTKVDAFNKYMVVHTKLEYGGGVEHKKIRIDVSLSDKMQP